MLDQNKKSKHTAEIASDYLHCALNPAVLAKAVNKIAKHLKKYDFDAIAFRGMSGALLAPLIAFKCKKSLLMVRKPKNTEDNHSCYPVEGDMAAKRYIIIDDFISSGRTVHAIIEKVSDFADEAVCVGAVLYNDIIKYGNAVKIHSMKDHATTELKYRVTIDPEIYKISDEQEK